MERLLYQIQIMSQYFLINKISYHSILLKRKKTKNSFVDTPAIVKQTYDLDLFNNGEQPIKTLPVIEAECILKGEDKLCTYCKTEMKSIGKEQVSQELQFISA